MSQRIASLYVGTRAGLFRLQDGVVEPVAADGATVRALLRLPDGAILAGTDDGRVLRGPGRDGGWKAAAAPDAGAIVSLSLVPGSATRVLAGTSRGRLLRSDDLGASFVEDARALSPETAPLELVAIPGRPRCVIALFRGGTIHYSSDGGERFQAWGAAGDAPLLFALPDPAEPHLWLGATPSGLLRSIDGARTFRGIDGLPAGLRPRALVLTSGTPRAWLLAHPAASACSDEHASVLWTSDDGGLRFAPTPARAIDCERDPT